MSKPLISIIIPCYNKGGYIGEAIASVEVIKTAYTYEFIIVDDGSDDTETINKLKELKTKGYQVIYQENMGPAAARNTGLGYARGKYILPLDSDNKLEKPYLTAAINLLETKPETDVVYGNSQFFGKQNFYNRIKAFDIKTIIGGNYIDTCAVIRKSILDKVGGYDTTISRGHEDWELWVHIFFKGGGFYYLDELCFYYRVMDTSMRFTAEPNTKKDRDYILLKNANTLLEFFTDNKWKIDYLKKEKVKGSINIFLGRVFN